MSSIPKGRRLAIDVGTKRVGLAISDPSSIIASPLRTVSPEDLIDSLRELVVSEEVSVIYVGLPLHLSGQEGISAEIARATASEIAEVLGIEVRLLDERLTTTSALKNSSGTKKPSKENVDQIAAVALLEFALQSERNRGELAGQRV
jgi:putative Holliday junction resolvase